MQKIACSSLVVQSPPTPPLVQTPQTFHGTKETKKPKNAKKSECSATSCVILLKFLFVLYSFPLHYRIHYTCIFLTFEFLIDIETFKGYRGSTTKVEGKGVLQH